ncbi:hypothetical protein NON00_04880 [Roseomonas sp. GC11]|uniref:hypothetical protein n=1 Tax=Roseomonas sp. GC11 TaxID=2950546 RepID=UPI0021087B56|nr:hypothetical protein [Roseomonas sp. GC11]MCQ4159256.1 hypothetical protein [Roseomonas sp. GC11]
MAPADESWAEAEALARTLAPELRSVVLTHYPDAETLDLLRPGEAASLAERQAANRAVAAEMLRQGVAVLVQQPDRAAARRWLDAHPGGGRAWRDREALRQGPEALRLLGLDPAKAPAPRADKGSGTPAERLMRLFAGEDRLAFETLAETLIQQGRDGVLDQAVRKVAQRYGEEAADDLAQDLLTLAEAAPAGPSGWAGLVALPVALSPGALPDPLALVEGLLASGALSEGVALHLLPEWRAPEAIAELTPVQARQVLLEMLAGQPPAALPPAEAAVLGQGSFAVLIGLQLDWDVPLWEEIAVSGLPEPPAEDAPATPEEEARAEAFDRWRSLAYQAQGGCVPLALVPLSETAAEIADFLEEADEQGGGALREIRDFIEVAREEARGEDVLCLPRATAEELHLTLYTRAGRLLDETRLEAERLPVPPAEMPALLEEFVALVSHRPQ